MQPIGSHLREGSLPGGHRGPLLHLEGAGIVTAFLEGDTVVSNKGLHTCSVLELISPGMLQLESHVQGQPEAPNNDMWRAGHGGVACGGGTLETPKCSSLGMLVSLLPHPHSKL